MSAKQKPVNKPRCTCLQQLSAACRTSGKRVLPTLADAEKLLANWKSNAVKRKKNCTSPYQTARRCHCRKSKAQAKAKARVKELEELLDALKDPPSRNSQLHFPTTKRRSRKA